MLVVNGSEAMADVQLEVDFEKFGYPGAPLAAQLYRPGRLQRNPEGTTRTIETGGSEPLPLSVAAHSWQLVRVLTAEKRSGN